MTNWALFGNLAIVAFVVLLASATCMFVYTRRLRKRPPSPFAEEIRGSKAILDRVRRREPMSAEELDYARSAIGDRSSLMAFSIPLAIFSLGCFYVFGSLEQLHGATP